MPILAFIASLFTPAVSILNNLHTSDEDKMKLQNELAKIQASVSQKMIELQEEQLKAQEADAQSKFWLTANWHALVSIILVLMLLLGSFNLIHLTESFYTLTQYFLIGYTGSHTVTQTISAIPNIVKKLKS